MSGQTSAEVSSGLLGPVQVTAAGSVFPVRAPRRRTLLAALLLRAGRTVATEKLADQVWDGAPPAGAATTLPSYVMRLRRALGRTSDAGRRLLTRAPGYLIKILHDSELDLRQFTALRRQADEAAAVQDWRGAAAGLRAAIGLWRGSALEDVPDVYLKAREMPALRAGWIQSHEDLARADLELGRPGDVAERIARLQSGFPYREELAEGIARRTLGYACGRMGHYRQAVRHFQAAAEIFQAAGTIRDRAVSRRGLAWVLGMSGRHDEAMVYAQQSMDLTRDSSLADQAHALNTVGRCHAYLGAYQFAVLTCGQALTLHQQECNLMGQAEAWYSLGLAHQGARQHDESVRAYQQALELFRELGDRHYIGETLAGLGDAHHALGDHARAVSLWQRALGILADIRHPDSGRVRAQLGATAPALSWPSADRSRGTSARPDSGRSSAPSGRHREAIETPATAACMVMFASARGGRP